MWTAIVAKYSCLQTNCIYELLPERALARAQELDDYFATHGKPAGPLHGLPISTKCHIGVEGRDSSIGFVGWVGRKNATDASVVQILLEAGAVIYARTTEPQGLVGSAGGYASGSAYRYWEG